MPRALVTGANGFVGRALTRLLLDRGWSVRGSVRSTAARAGLEPGTTPVETGELGPETDWAPALEGVDVVFHLAARVHRLRDAADQVAEYARVNTAGTERLARSAAAVGAHRLVFVSSIKVNGETREEPYTEADSPSPTDRYGMSKWEAELALQRVARETGLETVVLRPPLVYGPGVRANMLRLLRAVDRGLPLPLRGLRNRRSFLYVENLADALLSCAVEPRAAGHLFLVSDGTDFSTPDLILALAEALGRHARLVNIPLPVILAAGRLLGASAAVERLCGSLAVDSSRIRRDLSWSPPYAPRAGFMKTAAWYRTLTGRASSTRTGQSS
jgi:UDP-glucose 4-epimerase